MTNVLIGEITNSIFVEGSPILIFLRKRQHEIKYSDAVKFSKSGGLEGFLK